MNEIIRDSILDYVNANGATDTKTMVETMARWFETSKHRIAGNISYLVCKTEKLSILRVKGYKILS